MKTLLHPTYFPDIATFATIVQNDVKWEVKDNYQKQTYRNRCYIATDFGRHMLSIPIRHVGGKEGRQKYNDVLLDNSYQWQRQHWRTLQTAYRTSPFFEFYEDDIAPLFEKKFDLLLDYNLKTIATIADCLQIAMPLEKSQNFERTPQALIDARFLVNAKKNPLLEQASYVQVFGDRHGFIKNCSILDLLFNEGTNALGYLQNLHLSFLNA
ncbi:WbqC family protein [uncultured Kriegella sp.]|uniref:WbqC family protein n=1 Tax=uncultured Kriegella sp. TaxID=1798910 RepID=UPI0030DCE9B6